MRLVQNKLFGIAYWVVAFVATIFAAVSAGKASSGAAPEFGESKRTGVGSQFLFGAGGGLLAGLAVAALFAVVWMALWAADRRRHPDEESRDDFDTLDDLDDDFDAAERRHGAFDQDDEVFERDDVRDRLDSDEHARTH